MNWNYNLVGPPWLRRLRTAWSWYWSGRPFIHIHEIDSMLQSDDPIGFVRALSEYHHMLDKGKK